MITCETSLSLPLCVIRFHFHTAFSSLSSFSSLTFWLLETRCRFFSHKKDRQSFIRERVLRKWYFLSFHLSLSLHAFFQMCVLCIVVCKVESFSLSPSLLHAILNIFAVCTWSIFRVRVRIDQSVSDLLFSRLRKTQFIIIHTKILGREKDAKDGVSYVVWCLSLIPFLFDYSFSFHFRLLWIPSSSLACISFHLCSLVKMKSFFLLSSFLSSVLISWVRLPSSLSHPVFYLLRTIENDVRLPSGISFLLLLLCKKRRVA